MDYFNLQDLPHLKTEQKASHGMDYFSKPRFTSLESSKVGNSVYTIKLTTIYLPSKQDLGTSLCIYYYVNQD